MQKHCSRMISRIIVAVALVATGSVAAYAQPQVEIAVETGYTASEGIKASTSRIINGQIYNDLDITSGGNIGFTVGVLFTDNAEVEFLWNRQFSSFSAGNPAPSVDLADLSVDNFFGNFVYNWGVREAKVRPFMLVGIGATHYSPGDPVTLPATTPLTSIDSATKFAWTLGGGVKVYPAEHVGLRLNARWTPTYIKSDAEGLWCDPFYPTCWVLSEADYSNQFSIKGGITLRF